jgi:hypothetical protein
MRTIEDFEALEDMVRELREELDQCLMAGMTPARGIGEVEFIFDHPNGDEIVCHLEYDAGDPSEPERMTLVGAYIGAVDVHGLLPFAIIDQIEAEALGHSWP